MAKSSEQNWPKTSKDGEIHEPPLGVHVLTEFVFCPRAGVCAFEAGHEEVEDAPPLSFFPFHPFYSLIEIEAELERNMNELIWFVLAAALSVTLGFVVSLFVDRLIGFAGIFAMAWLLVFAAIRLVRVRHLQRQRQEALAAKCREPDLSSDAAQPIHWWDLLKAGFETQPVHDRLVDEELNFSGKPTRYLRRGNMVIPVWRMRHHNGPLHLQNYIRMTAYCHLVRASLGAGVECPFGVILFGHGFDGVAIPVSAERQAELRTALGQARETIHKADGGDKLHAPESAELCKRCPHGEPKKRKLNESENVCRRKTLLVIPAIAPDGTCFHSLCGDRFRWLPPHEAVEEKDLRLQA